MAARIFAQPYHKKLLEQPNLKLNDLVLLVEDNLPRGQWPLGRIVELFKGDDNRFRFVIVKTPRGEYHRPSAKICLLEEAVDG